MLFLKPKVCLLGYLWKTINLGNSESSKPLERIVIVYNIRFNDILTLLLSGFIENENLLCVWWWRMSSRDI